MHLERKPLIPQGAAFFQVRNEPRESRRFVFLLCPSFTLLAFSSALEPLRIANQLSQRALYDWWTLSEDGDAVTSSCGVSVNVDGSIGPLEREDVLLVCAGNRPPAAESAPVVALVHRHVRHGGAAGGLCTGAIALAKAGLLAKRRFTLHWENQPAFREGFPDLSPSENKFEIDGPIMTCGGGGAATELMLEVISRDHGHAFAAMVSDMCLRRIGIGRDLSQRSPISLVIESRNPSLVAIVDLMRRNMQEPLGLDEIADRVGYTRRHVERLFQTTVGQSPGKVYHNLRLDHGHNLLCSTNLTLSEIAAACGFESRSHFSKSFRKRFGIPPSRQHRRDTAPVRIDECEPRREAKRAV